MKKFSAAVVFLLLFVGTGVWYFGYHTKTPEYSLGLIRTAIEKHDRETFQKHVDLDSVLTHGLDDFLAATLQETEDHPLQEIIAQGILNAIKPAIVSGLRESILTEVEKGSAGDRPLGTDELMRRTGLRQAAFKGIDHVTRDGKVAEMGIAIDEPELGAYVLKLRMDELEDGTWRVTEITNLGNYLAALAEARRAAQRQYLEETQPIIDRYDEELEQIRAKSPLATPELVKKMKENRQALAEALAAIPTPEAARLIADRRTEYIAATQEYLEGIAKELAGDDSFDRLRETRDANVKAAELEGEVQRLEEQIRGET